MRNVSNELSWLSLTRQLLPDRAEEIARLAAISEPFRSLCEDYALAVNTLRRLESENRQQDVERMVEYRELIAELERELSESLGAVSK
ncbi:MAG: hypothetical protein GEU87_01270 [Alphaproteobacteria bacterium]|nr:hypothetical protein [Alphaproteobacteria bacterium]